MDELRDEGHVSPGQNPRLRRFVVVGLFGLLMVMVGLAVDSVLHAVDENLAAEEGLFTVRNPGHLFLALGIVATAAGLSGTASIMLRSTGGDSGWLRIARISLRVGMLGLVAAFAYIAAGPGFGHGHEELAGALELTDGSFVSSSAAANVDRSRLPAGEAAALASLAWSRSGNVEVGPEHKHESKADGQLTASQAKALEAQLAIATAVVPKYPTPAEAEADGYVRASDSVNGVGAHWVKWSLVDRAFDPATPSMLLFEEVKWGEGPALVGFSYWVMSEEEPEGFAGGTDAWHGHYGLCFDGGFLIAEGIPDRGECVGDWVNGSDLWMLHAWVVPGMESRFGTFSAVNERLCERSCG